MYGLIQGIAAIVMLVCGTLYGVKYGIPKLKALILTSCMMICYLVLVKFLAWIELGFQSFGSENAIRVYVFMSFCAVAAAKIAKINPLQFLDMQAPAWVLTYGVGHFACVFAGCCHGFAYYEGTVMYKIAHALTGTNMLPMQIFESVSAILIFFILHWRGKACSFQANGRIFCLYYITFGFQRFLWEFLRDNKKIIAFAPLKQADGVIGISTLAIWAFLMCMVGFLVLYVIHGIEKENSVCSAQA